MDQTLELVWQQDATAILFVRDADGALSAGDLTLGKPGIGEARAGRRRLSGADGSTSSS